MGGGPSLSGIPKGDAGDLYIFEDVNLHVNLRM